MGIFFGLAALSFAGAEVTRFSPLVALSAAALLALVLTQAAMYQSPDPPGRWFFWLLVADGVLIFLIFCAACATAFRLAAAWRRDAPGGRLAMRLGGVLLGAALLPSAVLYGVSAAGIFRSIDSWFATPLGRSFEQGEAFGKSVLNGEFASLEVIARDLAGNLRGGGALPFWVEDFRLFHELDGVALYDSEGRALAASGKEAAGGRLPAAALAKLREKPLHRDLSDFGIAVVARAPAGGGVFAVRIARALPADLLAGLREVELGRREYDKLLAVRRGLRLSFLLTLTLAFLMILLASAAAALWLGGRLSHPLVRMASAATAVGRGDFSGRLAESGSDEIGMLSRAFNAMVDDLAQSRRTAEERRAALAAANLYLENLLASLSSGVLVFDEAGRLSQVNAAASRLLRADLNAFVGKPAQNTPALAGIAETVAVAVGETQERRLAGPGDSALVARTRRLSPSRAGAGTVIVVVDDITRQMRAEREAAWEEASRRFAHEIKNPLTPIRLAAERLGRKLSGKLPAEEKETLERLVTTIVNQVDAMREMVDSFRGNAGERPQQTERVDLSALVREVARLYERPGLRLSLDLAQTPAVAAAPLILRQVLHNLLSNAAEAVAEKESPEITVALRPEKEGALLTVCDNGGGLPEEIAGKLFEPYVTTKPGGTGLGLAMARKAIAAMGGEVAVENSGEGVRAAIYLPAFRESENESGGEGA